MTGDDECVGDSGRHLRYPVSRDSIFRYDSIVFDLGE
jgi:hypothetical protein